MRRATFAEILERLLPEITRIVRSGRQYVPGMTQDEIRAELIECLWTARKSYDRRLNDSFEAYWWSVWVHRKADLIKYSLRGMRDHRLERLEDDEWFWQESRESMSMWPTISPTLLPDPPQDAGPVERQVWMLVSIGASTQDVIQFCNLPKHRYYKIIYSWRTPQIRSMLK